MPLGAWNRNERSPDTDKRGESNDTVAALFAERDTPFLHRWRKDEGQVGTQIAEFANGALYWDGS